MLDAAELVAESGYPDSKVHGTKVGPIWGRQDPGGLHVGPMNFALWALNQFAEYVIF